MSSEWRVAKVEDIAAPFSTALATGPFGSAISSKYFVASGVPVIRGSNLSADISTRLIDAGLVFISQDKANEFQRSVAKRGDLVFTCWGTINQVGLIDGRSKFDSYIVSNKQMKLTIDPAKADHRFIYYVFSGPAKQNEILENGIGSSVPGFNLGQLKRHEVLLPPVQEQRQIADFLETLDDRITLLRETNATLEAIAQVLFKSWFVDFDPVRAKAEGRQPEGMDAATAALFPDSFEESELGLVPRGWRVGTVADLGEVICGKTPPTSQPENYGDDVPFITIPDMHGRLLVTSTNRSLSRLGADTQKKKYLPVGSVCVSCIATPGLVVRVTSVAQTNQQINSVVPSENWGKSFPLFLLRRIGDAVRAGGSGGSVFHNLSKAGFEELKVLLVSENLAQRFDEIVEPLITKILKNQRQSETLTQLRDALLPRLISGQLRLPEAETLIAEAV